MLTRRIRMCVGIGLGMILLAIGLLGYGLHHSIYAADPANWDAAQCRQHLKDTEAGTRAAAVKRLGELKDMTAITDLASMLHDTDAETRRQAVTALGEIGNASALKAFFDTAFWDKDSKVRAEAARAVGKIKDTTAIKSLLQANGHTAPNPALSPTIKFYQSTKPLAFLLRDADAGVREQAAWALGEIGDGWAVDDLVKTTIDADVQTRCHSCAALGKIKDPRAIAALQKALNDADANTRAAAATALQAITGQAPVAGRAH